MIADKLIRSGVLTKPDTVDPGSSIRTQWLQIIEGHRHPLKHGYYCVRQPNDVERQRGSDARKIEADYFEQTAPWSTSSCRDRFGTRNLVNTMANLLKQMTQRSSVSSQLALISLVALTLNG